MEKIPLDEEKGVHILANIIEGNYDSINRDYYGSFYQYLLNIFGNIDDPKHRYEVKKPFLHLASHNRDNRASNKSRFLAGFSQRPGSG